MNQLLEKYKIWNLLFDSALIAGVDDIDIVYNWRADSTQERRGMMEAELSPEELTAFCNKFMPSYDCYLKPLMEEGIPNVPDNRTLRFKLSEDRRAFL